MEHIPGHDAKVTTSPETDDSDVSDFAKERCRFCGKKGDLAIVDEYAVKCFECGARGPERDTRKEAGEAWDEMMRPSKRL